MRQLCVIGGTRGVGRHCVRQALLEGSPWTRVSVLARDPSKFADLSGGDRLAVVQGDACDSAALDACIRDSEAVIVSLGSGPGASPEQLKICSASMPLILSAMRQHRSSVRRIIVISSMGVGDSLPDISDRARMFLKPYLDDKEIQERLLAEQSDVEWVVVRPSGLQDSETVSGGKYRVGKGIPSIPVLRADVAEFALRQIDSDEWLRQSPSITGLAPPS